MSWRASRHALAQDQGVQGTRAWLACIMFSGQNGICSVTTAKLSSKRCAAVASQWQAAPTERLPR